MGKESFMPLYWGDLLASTAGWRGEERALYLTLLAYQWTMGALPSESDELMRLAQYHAKNWRKMFPKVAQKFPICDDGLRRNPRLEEHRQRHKELKEKRKMAGQAGMAKRWGLTTRDSFVIAPNLTKSKKEETPLPPFDNKAIDESQQTEKTLSVRRPSKPRKINFTSPDPPAGLNLIAWETWTNYRVQIGKRLKPASIPAAMKKLAAFGDAQMAAVEQSIANGWQGLFDPQASRKAVSLEAERRAQADLRKLADAEKRADAIGFRKPTPGEDVGTYVFLVERAERQRADAEYRERVVRSNKDC